MENANACIVEDNVWPRDIVVPLPKIKTRTAKKNEQLLKDA
jgi:hypothetical protein